MLHAAARAVKPVTPDLRASEVVLAVTLAQYFDNGKHSEVAICLL
jgi:hypothetical protein